MFDHRLSPKADQKQRPLVARTKPIFGSPFRRRARTYAAIAAVALAASAVCALVAPQAKAAAAAPRAACASVANPYRGAHVALVYAQHGIAVRRYTKAGLGPLYVATADIANAVPGPILPGHVTTRTEIGKLVAGSRALVGVNGDFFRQYGDGSPMSVEVVAGRVIKARAFWQPALITTPAGRLIYGPLRATIGLTVHNRTSLASTINDPSMPRNGVSVFTSAWGARQPARSHGVWREWIVSHGRVVASHAYATPTLIPSSGFVVEASGPSASRLQAMGWGTGALVGVRANAISTVGPVYSALGAGSRLVHGGLVDRGGCVTDTPTGRTSVGIYAGARKIALASVSSGRGLSERELAAFMRSLGVAEAVSLDGGGSSTMASHGRRFTAPRFNGRYRAVANGFGFYPR